METTTSFWAEFVNIRLVRLSLTTKSLINLKINCKVSGLVDSKCVKYATACVSVHSGYGVFRLCKRWICSYQWRGKNVLKLQLCFHESSKPDKANIWLGIFQFPVVAAFLLYFHCCLFVSWLLNEILLCLLFLTAIRRKNASFRNRKEYSYHGILWPSTCIARCCGNITLPFPIPSYTWSFPLHRAEGGAYSRKSFWEK